MRYYHDDEKLTFDEADELTHRYLREYAECKVIVRSRYVADAYGIPATRHNLIRICDALDRRLTCVEKAGTTTKTFRITQDDR